MAINRSTSSNIRSRVGTAARGRFILPSKYCTWLMANCGRSGAASQYQTRLAQSIGREIASFRLFGLTLGEFMMHWRTRLASDGGTPRLRRGVDSEYGTLRDVLVGPIIRQP